LNLSFDKISYINLLHSKKFNKFIYMPILEFVFQKFNFFCLVLFFYVF